MKIEPNPWFQALMLSFSSCNFEEQMLLNCFSSTYKTKELIPAEIFRMSPLRILIKYLYEHLMAHYKSFIRHAKTIYMKVVLYLRMRS